MIAQSRQEVWQTMTVGILVLLLILISGCLEAKHQNGSETASTSQDVPPDGGSTIPVEVKPAGLVIGVRNYDAIFANLLNVTGINRADCQAEFTTQQTSLPEFNEMGSLGAAAQSSLIKLVGCVCRSAIVNNSNTARTRLTPNFPFNKTASTLTDQEITAGISQLLDAAWGPAALAHLPDRTQTTSMMLELAKGLIQDDANRASTAATTRVVFGLCTAAFGSPAAQIL